MFRLFVRPTINSHYYSGQSILFPVLLLCFIFCVIRIYLINQHIVIEQVSFIYINGKSIEQKKNHNLFNIVKQICINQVLRYFIVLFVSYHDTISFCGYYIVLLVKYHDTLLYWLLAIAILYRIA